MEKVKNEVVKSEVEAQSTPADMIRMAVQGGADLEKLEKLMILQERWEANESKKAFIVAMTKFKAEAPKVTKDKINKQYNSRYTSLDNLVNIVNPVLSKHGLSASWDIEQNGVIRVSCKITHEKGHSEIASASAPADESGSKNKVQQIKSSITYLKAVTFESICGLASTDANVDDDGNGSVEIDYIDKKQKSIILDMIADTNTDIDAFLKYLKIDSIDAMSKTQFKKAVLALETKKNKEKK